MTASNIQLRILLFAGAISFLFCSTDKVTNHYNSEHSFEGNYRVISRSPLKLFNYLKVTDTAIYFWLLDTAKTYHHCYEDKYFPMLDTTVKWSYSSQLIIKPFIAHASSIPFDTQIVSDSTTTFDSTFTIVHHNNGNIDFIWHICNLIPDSIINDGCNDVALVCVPYMSMLPNPMWPLLGERDSIEAEIKNGTYPCEPPPIDTSGYTQVTNLNQISGYFKSRFHPYLPNITSSELGLLWPIFDFGVNPHCNLILVDDSSMNYYLYDKIYVSPDVCYGDHNTIYPNSKYFNVKVDSLTLLTKWKASFSEKPFKNPMFIIKDSISYYFLFFEYETDDLRITYKYKDAMLEFDAISYFTKSHSFSTNNSDTVMVDTSYYFLLKDSLCN